MPTTVTASNGNTYHLWQLPDLTTPEPEDSISFTTLDNNLSDGYRATSLFGSNTGVRKWTLKFPTLASLEVLSNTVTDINGAAVSREQYVRSLYAENKVTGTPFAYQCPATGQYYLVDFEDEELSLARMRVKIYSTGLTLKQRRLTGVTIFDPHEVSGIWARWVGTTSFATNTWNDTSASPLALTRGATDVIDVSAAQNGLQIKRFSNTTNDGYVARSGSQLVTYEAFIALKIRDTPTFSNAAGIITDTGGAGEQILIGDSGTSKFADLSLTDYEYRLNGTEYTAANQQAPMNTWGIVHVRYPTGWDLTSGLQFGKNRTTAGTFAEMDLGEVILFNNLISTADARQITEYLTVKWGIV